MAEEAESRSGHKAGTRARRAALLLALLPLLGACLAGSDSAGDPPVDAAFIAAVHSGAGRMLSQVEPSPIKVAGDAVVLIPSRARAEQLTQAIGIPAWGLPGVEEAVEARRQRDALAWYEGNRTLAEAIVRAAVFTTARIVEYERFPDPASHLAEGAIVVAHSFDLQGRNEEREWWLYRSPGAHAIRLMLELEFDPARTEADTLNLWLAELARLAAGGDVSEAG